jgi:hypothetical protein
MELHTVAADPPFVGVYPVPVFAKRNETLIHSKANAYRLIYENEEELRRAGAILRIGARVYVNEQKFFVAIDALSRRRKGTPMAARAKRKP